MKFQPDTNGLTLSHRDGRSIVFTVTGTESWREGEYTNERNAEIEYRIPVEQAEEMVDELNEMLK